ncbi:YybH family protein [Streptomyces sp. NBC_00344]|uniref:YybH family protein n=1 Tax=Streptomyces sp. NBC_00344 TaxID=2975720 RepID=UPI002E20D4BF
MTSTPDTEAILRDVLDRWKAAVDAHEPDQVAVRFTDDAIFQGLHPYSVGRQGVAAYYAAQPLGMTAQYRVLETRQLADDLILGYQSVMFGFIDRPPLTVNLSLLLRRLADGWYIAHYQVTLLP